MRAGVSSSQLTGAARVGAALRSVAPLAAAARATHMLCGSNRAAPFLRGAQRTLDVALRAGGVTSAGISAGAMERGAALLPRHGARLFPFATSAAVAAGAFSLFGASAAAAAEAVPPADAEALAQPELVPSLCAVKLRELDGWLDSRRRQHEHAQKELRKALEAAEAKVVRCQEELALQLLLSAHCTRVGDAAGAAECDEAARVAAQALETAQNLLQEERTTGWPQKYVGITAKDLAQAEREYTLLRAYTQERYGAEWVAKSAIPKHKLSDAALRAQAHDWRPEAAPAGSAAAQPDGRKRAR
jgi:hypothetical protein